MLKSKIPFQNIESIPQLIKDFLNEEIPQFSSYKFSLKMLFLKQKKNQNRSLKNKGIYW
jgi:hypothetical protein